MNIPSDILEPLSTGSVDMSYDEGVLSETVSDIERFLDDMNKDLDDNQLVESFKTNPDLEKPDKPVPEVKPRASTPRKTGAYEKQLEDMSISSEIDSIPPDADEYETTFVAKSKIIRRARQLSNATIDSEPNSSYGSYRSYKGLNHSYERMERDDAPKHHVYVYSDYIPMDMHKRLPFYSDRKRNANMADIFRMEVKADQKWWTMAEFYKECLSTASQRIIDTFPLNILTKAKVKCNFESKHIEYRSDQPHHGATIYRMTPTAMSVESKENRPKPLMTKTGSGGTVTEIKITWDLFYDNPIVLEDKHWEPELRLAEELRRINTNPAGTLTRLANIVTAYDQYRAEKEALYDRDGRNRIKNYPFINEPEWNKADPWMVKVSNADRIDEMLRFQVEEKQEAPKEVYIPPFDGNIELPPPSPKVLGTSLEANRVEAEKPKQARNPVVFNTKKNKRKPKARKYPVYDKEFVDKMEHRRIQSMNLSKRRLWQDTPRCNHDCSCEDPPKMYPEEKQKFLADVYGKTSLRHVNPTTMPTDERANPGPVRKPAKSRLGPQHGSESSNWRYATRG